MNKLRGSRPGRPVRPFTTTGNAGRIIGNHPPAMATGGTRLKNFLFRPMNHFMNEQYGRGIRDGDLR